MSSRRILAMLQKDLTWSRQNYKLLALMVFPVIFSVLFARSEATFIFAIIFNNVFIGLFTTSYLVIEEKTRGTLLSVLTTPLTTKELLASKFLFNLILCLFFSFVSILVRGRLDLFTNSLALVQLFLFAGTTCFLGFTIGVFCKNEQEMSVVAPFSLLLFFGEIFERFSHGAISYAFFPDYHLAQTIRGLSFNIHSTLFHLFFSILYFSIAFVIATSYTQFYFSNSRDRRFSFRLIIHVALFVGALLLSGFLNSKLFTQTHKNEDLVEQKFSSHHFSGQYEYSSLTFNHTILINSDESQVRSIEFKNSSESNIIVSIRKLQKDEGALELRQKKVLEDESRTLLGHQKDQEKWLLSWVYIQGSKIIFLNESICQDEILQVSLDVSIKDLNKIKNLKPIFDHFNEKISFQCRGHL